MVTRNIVSVIVVVATAKCWLGGKEATAVRRLGGKVLVEAVLVVVGLIECGAIPFGPPSLIGIPLGHGGGCCGSVEWGRGVVSSATTRQRAWQRTAAHDDHRPYHC